MVVIYIASSFGVVTTYVVTYVVTYVSSILYVCNSSSHTSHLWVGVPGFVSRVAQRADRKSV